MPLSSPVLQAVDKISDPQIRAEIHRALEMWTLGGQHIGEHELASLSHVPATVSTLLDIVGLGTLVPGIISEWAAAASPSNVGMWRTDTLLDRTLAWLIRRYRRHGRLTYETREHYKHLIRALSNTHLRDD